MTSEVAGEASVKAFGLSSVDVAYMRRALRLAAQAHGRTSPNPMVGAVVVRDDAVVGAGYHHRAGEAHAEVLALRRAGRLAEGSTLYVTLEPCCHVGRTPPCVDAVTAAGVTRVVAAMLDPDPRVNGVGFARLAASGIETVSGVCSIEAARLNEGFLSRVVRGRPFVLLVQPGREAWHPKRPDRWPTSPEAVRRLARLRDRYDAVLVDVRSLRPDDFRFRAVRGRSPLCIALDPEARMSARLRLAAQAAGRRTWAVVATDADSKAVARIRSADIDIIAVPRIGTLLDIRAVLRELARRGINAVLSEADSYATMLVQSALVDRTLVVVTPPPVASDAVSLHGPPSAHDVTLRRWGDAYAVTFERGSAATAAPARPHQPAIGGSALTATP